MNKCVKIEPVSFRLGERVVLLTRVREKRIRYGVGWAMRKPGAMRQGTMEANVLKATQNDPID